MPKRLKPEAITAQAYEAGWKAFRDHGTRAAVRRVTGWRDDTAKRVIETGSPVGNLPAYASRLEAIAALSIQMDTSEAARSIAAGRGFLRRAMTKMGNRIASFDVDKLPISVAMNQLPRYVELNEQLSRLPVETDAAASTLEKAANVQEAVAGLLSEVAKLAKQSIPMSTEKKNGKANGNGAGKDPLAGLTPEEILHITEGV